eukprot:TRINITY_DN58439_c0_g1_i1.p1 TRINITY_DN58439_c0_g1~~TRINITY_DN58439_c0_g1_i1.p1  ORF type:complete len:343 (+),score=35.25 TRINITY_DN58439_c0_g1_i1:116-1144(+)
MEALRRRPAASATLAPHRKKKMKSIVPRHSSLSQPKREFASQRQLLQPFRRQRTLRVRCVGGTVALSVGGVRSPEVQTRVNGLGQRRWMVRAKQILEKEGLVVLRGILPSGLVRAARRRILVELDSAHALARGKTARMEARVSHECLDGQLPLPSLLRRLDVQGLPAVRCVLEHPKLFAATAALLGVDETVTTAYKWLRAVPPGAFTGPHMDRAYVGAGKRLTIWVPLGDIFAGPGGLGSLCWIPRSHVTPAVVERFSAYQRAGNDGERSGWLAPDPGALELPAGCRWRSANFKEGDVAVFGMDMLHTTIPNETTCFRLSCDTRWQPADSPVGDVGPWRKQL